MIASTKELEVGDFLKYDDTDQMLAHMEQSAKIGVETDWCNHRNGEDGIWLEVIRIKKDDQDEKKKLLEAMHYINDFCEGQDGCAECYFGYGKHYCFFDGCNPTEWGFKSIFED